MDNGKLEAGTMHIERPFYEDKAIRTEFQYQKPRALGIDVYALLPIAVRCTTKCDGRYQKRVKSHSHRKAVLRTQKNQRGISVRESEKTQ
ncbi:hypothetical protein GWI33_005246 [Rhynchophorus ferrugineus]|uniref:Uncharacterized protein n=1 Tax=Rhynchophorus ferrugineus TaxID=354439 RepID=A0A834IHT2_RHYFE|nr:hypothetical protein GWI33_005246 [Rhynchophorus ferrugineus]